MSSCGQVHVSRVKFSGENEEEKPERKPEPTPQTIGKILALKVGHNDPEETAKTKQGFRLHIEVGDC